MSIEDNQYITASQAAKIARLHLRYFFTLLKQGDGPPAHEIAGRRVYVAGQVRKWDEERSSRLRVSGRPRKSRKE